MMMQLYDRLSFFSAKEVMFSLTLVCLLAGLHKTTRPFCTKFSGRWHMGDGRDRYGYVPVIPCDTGYVLFVLKVPLNPTNQPGYLLPVRLTVTIMWDQQPWWRDVLYCVPFQVLLLYDLSQYCFVNHIHIWYLLGLSLAS